jgi:tetratricopeptide (TPR) repeat protein
MIKELKISPSEKNIYYTILIITASVLFLLTPHSAVNVDEQLHYPHAKSVVNWYFTGGKDQSCLYTPVTNLKYYGQSVDNFTALVNRIFSIDNEFLVRHFTGAFFFWLLLYFSGKLSFEITGSHIAAGFTVLSLILMPRLAGQAFGNLKDIPFAVGYMAGILMIVRFIKEFPVLKWKTAVLLGIAIAFTVSVRAGGFILFAYLGLTLLIFFIWKPFYLIQVVSTKPVFARLLVQGAIVLAIGYMGGLLFWPYALQNIFVHPFESLRVMEHYKVSIRQVFEGEMMWSTQLPWYYLPKWIMISSPVFLLAGIIVYSIFFLGEFFRKFLSSRLLFAESFILFSVIFPLIYVIVIGSNLYSGIRQMIFILPPMALLAVIGIYRLVLNVKMKNRQGGYVLASFFLILMVLPFRHQAATFPADYIYFNMFAGGNKNAWSNYEYDYYFHSIKEPAELLVQLASGKEVVVGMNCNLSNYFDAHPNISYKYTRYLERSSADWDYGIFGLNYLHPYLLKNNLWQTTETIQTFYHKGNPVAILVKRNDRSDLYGISEIANGNWQKGISLLEAAVDKDSNNVWLNIHLAKAKLALNELDGYQLNMEMGRSIHPYYEPFYLLEANRYFEHGKYTEAMDQLELLYKINPKYLPAKELYEELKKKIKLSNH